MKSSSLLNQDFRRITANYLIHDTQINNLEMPE